MENLYINGHSLRYIDRSFTNRETARHFKFHNRLFVPFSTPSQKPSSVHTIKNTKAKVKSKRKLFAETVEHENSNSNGSRIFQKRPKRFKNYYTDRQPLSITRFEFPRLGEQLLNHENKTFCKYHSHNEIINDKLFGIKTVQDFERILNSRLRHRRDIEPFYGSSTIPTPSLRPLASETCLHTKDYYRLNCIHEDYYCYKQPYCRPTPLLSRATTSNAATKFKATDSSLEKFICLAAECYNRCIKYYLNNLNDCNRKVEKSSKRQSVTDQKASDKKEPNTEKPPETTPIKERESVNEQPLVNQLNRLNINLHHTTSCDDTHINEKTKNTGQSTAIFTQCRSQAMSWSDSNDSSTESTNHMQDPPKIIFSDFSTAKQQTQDKSDKDLSDNRSAIERNCLSIPKTRYCSEARPP